MIKVYTGELLAGIPYTEILYPNLGSKERETPFGENIFDQFTEPIVEIAKDPVEADYLCIPHNYNYIKKNVEYIASFAELSQTYSKKILIFFPGDSDEEILIPNSIIFRNSQYGYKKQDNEIIMPGYAVDLGRKYGLLERKKGEVPVVGFCGWANYRTLHEWLSYAIYNIMESLVGHPVHKKGLYFRRQALQFLKKQGIASNFLIRSSYSMNSKTLTVDPIQARNEYVENIKNSDYTLAPKGDGNFSVRFYESLSLGRIPLLIDTNCPLPLEKDIDYSHYILKVNYKDVPHIGEIVKDHFDDIQSESYFEKQKALRGLFEHKLKIDVFFRFMFSDNNLERYAFGD